MNGDTYYLGAVVTGVLSFIGIWIYAIAEWGLLVGLVIGWLPALIGAFICAFIWPLIALAIAAIVLLIVQTS